MLGRSNRGVLDVGTHSGGGSSVRSRPEIEALHLARMARRRVPIHKHRRVERLPFLRAVVTDASP